MIFPGWVIARVIPYKYLTGLLTGEYTLTGGVIRHAAGTLEGGQIVAHLLPAGSSLLSLVPGLNFIPGIIANAQLYNVSEKLNTVAEMTQINSHTLLQLSGQMTSLSQATQYVLHFAAGTAVLSGLSLAVSSIGFIAVNRKLKSFEGYVSQYEMLEHYNMTPSEFDKQLAQFSEDSAVDGHYILQRAET